MKKITGVKQTRRAPALAAVEALRATVGKAIPLDRKSEYGQFFTPRPIAQLMGAMTEAGACPFRILDAGAGVGSLFTAVVDHLCQRKNKPKEIQVSAYELDPQLCERLKETLEHCRGECEEAGVVFSAEVVQGDFLAATADALDERFFSLQSPERYDLAILNPPYGKIHSQSNARKTLQRIGIETSNIYTGFLAAAVHLLRPGGELIAITPRSFFNGSYFRPFRRWFLKEMTLQRIHTFLSREKAFRDDDVLQETVIFRAVKHAPRAEVMITSTDGPNEELMSRHVAEYAEVVQPNDPESFIRIQIDPASRKIAELMATCRKSLGDIGLEVSTGRVVDFRATSFLRKYSAEKTVPLIYPMHFSQGVIAWPKEDARKPEAIVDADETRGILVPNENYVLVKRFSAKEERRRIVAAVYEAQRLDCRLVGFENHLNYFHCQGRGLPIDLARGLAAFLNTTLVDQYFRQFSGHTQVNATDLRNMRFPNRQTLERIGSRIGEEPLEQAGIDDLLKSEIHH